MLPSVSHLKIRTYNEHSAVTKPADLNLDLQPSQNICNSHFYGYETTLLSLPINVIKIIFEHLKHEDLIAMSQVCTKSRPFARRHIKHLNFSKDSKISERTLCQAFKDWSQPNSACTSIKLSNCSSVNADSIQCIAECFPFLDVLNVHSCESLNSSAFDIISKLSHLTTLCLGGNNWILSADLKKLKSLTTLTALSVRECPNLDTTDALKELTTLTRLDISWCKNLIHLDGVKSLKNLRFLAMSGYPQSSVIYVMKNFPSIDFLDLS